jgi:acyl carrier protein
MPRSLPGRSQPEQVRLIAYGGAGWMKNELTLERVPAIVALIAGPHQNPPDAGPDTPLGGGGFWLDSVSLLEVIIACEADFEMAFDPEADITEGSVSTVRTLFHLIQVKES